MKPQHFDILGVAAFLYVVGFALFMVTHEFQAPPLLVWILLGIGVAGLLVDVAIVIRYFVVRKK